MVNRERKIVTTPAELLDLEYKTLQSARDLLDELIEKYGSTAKIEYHQQPWSDESYLYVFENKPETDEQMATRIANEEKLEADRDARDRKEFERLQAKFGAINE